MKTLTFDFFGTLVAVSVADVDVDILLFFHGSCLTHSCELPDLHCTLDDEEGDAGFFASLLAKDGNRKRLSLRDISGAVIADKTFSTWSEVPSPIPPFSTSPLFERLATNSGSVVQVDQHGLLILGPNYVGKTAVTLSLCEQGALFVSDSVAVVDVVRRKALTYSPPLGLRRRTLERYADLLRTKETRETISPVTGRVVLARVSDVLGDNIASEVRVDHVVCLYPQRDKAPGRVTQQPMPDLGWYGGASAHQVAAALPEELTLVGVPPLSSPESVARQIREDVLCS